MSKHLKRLYAPKTWQILRKEKKYISKPSPGPHSQQLSLPLVVAIRDCLESATSAREVKYLLNNRTVLVNGRQRKEYRYPLGLFDVVTFKEVNESFRLVLNTKGKLSMIREKDPQTTIARIMNKSMAKGKVQLNLSDGSNFSVEKGSSKYGVGDSLTISLKEGKREIVHHFSLGKGSFVILIGGKNIGATGKVEDIAGNKIMYKTDDTVAETLKKYAFVLGKDKPAVTIH